MNDLFIRAFGGVASSVQALASLVASSAYAAGNPYVPLAKNATEQYVAFDLIAPQAGTLKITLLYAPSASNGGDVVFELDYLKVSAAGDPNAAITTQSSFTFTPGTGATLKTVGQDTQATLGITVAAGDYVYLKLSRKNAGGDTHTGSMNVVGIKVSF